MNRRNNSGDAIDRESDRGSVSAFVVVAAIGLLIAAGLVLDGGTALATRGAAATAAQQAARAGADAIAPASLRSADPTGLALSPGAARAAANRVLAAAGATGTVTITGTAVTVTARITHHTFVLSAVGVDEVTGTGSFTATPVHGTTNGSG